MYSEYKRCVRELPKNSTSVGRAGGIEKSQLCVSGARAQTDSKRLSFGRKGIKGAYLDDKRDDYVF